MRPLLLAALTLLPMAATAQPLTCDILRDNGQLSPNMPPMVLNLFPVEGGTGTARTPNGQEWTLLHNPTHYFIWRRSALNNITLTVNRATGAGEVSVVENGSTTPNFGPVFCRRPARL